MAIYPAPDMQRRKFVRNGLILSTSLTHVAQLFAFETSVADSSITDDLLEFVRTHSISTDIGKQFLKRTRQNSIDPGELLNSLQTSLLMSRSYSESATLQDLLLDRIAQDFEENRLCNIDSWSLSLTECRLAGLKALMQKESKQNLHNESPEFLQWPNKNIVDVKTWGPQITTQGVGFNTQSSGASALWIVTNGDFWYIKYLHVYLGEQRLVSIANKKGIITADLLPKNLSKIIDQPGNYPVYLVDAKNRTKQLIGGFKVIADNAKAAK